ncbi:MAG: acyl-[Muribaculaceae bacterium]|nr:acyl-[acyl-carrier-protein]--UDP-N-acetylglucosamine O-acyltransferase [Muribaculaceae bacterium]
VGLHRHGYSSEQIDAIADVYRTIYDSGLNVTQSLEEAAKLPASAERDTVIDFVRASKRGIVRKPYGLFSS